MPAGYGGLVAGSSLQGYAWSTYVMDLYLPEFLKSTLNGTTGNSSATNNVTSRARLFNSTAPIGHLLAAPPPIAPSPPPPHPPPPYPPSPPPSPPPPSPPPGAVASYAGFAPESCARMGHARPDYAFGCYDSA